jgi:hypothetical protein
VPALVAGDAEGAHVIELEIDAATGEVATPARIWQALAAAKGGA